MYDYHRADCGMADSEVKNLASEGATADKSNQTTNATSNSDRTETLEDLMTTLSQQINDSDWLQLNTAEKFAAENPEVAKAFRDATLKSSQDGGVPGDS
ncbi:hypothetical protein BsWGS_27021 [Bradybaena similaris]